jgi:DNA gyrase/topoisomerase IV, subunit A
MPNGAFGSRLGNGGDSASPRYIYTYANPVTRTLFRPEDDALLVLKREEGAEVEPANYLPVLPLLLINGCSAIATGFSTTVRRRTDAVTSPRCPRCPRCPRTFHPPGCASIGPMLKSFGPSII